MEIVWVKIPRYLLEKGIFTDLDGWLPLPHYMWMCPALLGGVSLFIFYDWIVSYFYLMHPNISHDLHLDIIVHNSILCR